MRAIKQPFLITTFLVLVSGLLYAQTSATALFSRGNEFYKNNQYEEAAKDYENLLDMGVVSGQVYYNLGNTYFKKGEIGKAVLYYEKAQALLPRDDDIKANLDFVRLLISGERGGEERGFLTFYFSQLLDYFNLRELALAESSLFVFLSLLITNLLLTKRLVLRHYLNVTLYPASVLLFVSVLLLGIKIYQLEYRIEGIIMIPSTEARSGPGIDNTRVLLLPEGVKVEVRDRREGWLLVTLPSGASGWVEESNLDVI